MAEAATVVNAGRLYFGIDPGLGGAVAVLGGGDGPLVFDTPTLEVERRGKRRREYALDEMWALLERFVGPHTSAGHPVAVIERVSCRPGEGIVSAQRAGEGCGLWRAFLYAAQISTIPVTPQTWKKWAGLLGTDKAASRLRAAERWPGVPLGLVKHHGRSDALWMAAFAQTLDW